MDLIKRLLDLLPVIREGPFWLQALFLVWLLISFALVFGLALQGLRSKAPTLPEFVMELSSNQYIEEPQLALSGKGLPADAELEVRAYFIAGGLRRVTPQIGEVVRLPTGDWRYQWVAFQQVGKHEIEVRVVREGKVVALAGPVAIHLGAWAAAAPSKPARSPEPAPALPTPDENVLDLSRWVSIHNQGAEGTSSAFAAVTAMETWLARSGDQAELSARYVYEKAKQHDGLGADTEGTFLTTIAYIIQHFGVPNESTWSYQAGERTLPSGTTWADLDRKASRSMEKSGRHRKTAGSKRHLLTINLLRFMRLPSSDSIVRIRRCASPTLGEAAGHSAVSHTWPRTQREQC